MEYIAGHAKFTGPKEVTVDGAKYTAEHILIATGTKPIIPSIPGDHAMCVSVWVCEGVWVWVCVCVCGCVRVWVCGCVVCVCGCVV